MQFQTLGVPQHNAKSRVETQIKMCLQLVSGKVSVSSFFFYLLCCNNEAADARAFPLLDPTVAISYNLLL